MKLVSIASNTFRENIRDKILYNLILFALLMILSSMILGQLTLGHEVKVIVDLGLSAISIFGTLIAIFIGIGLVYKELEKRTVYALLAKPIRRWEFVVGKYLGLLFTLLVNVGIMAIGLALTILYHGGLELRGFLTLLPAIYLTFLSLALTTALALVFSTFSTPALSALFTLFLWTIGHFNSDLLDFGELTQSRVLAGICRVLYYALPNISNFTVIDGRNVIQEAAYHQTFDVGTILWITAYGLCYSGLLVGAAVMIFNRRDFK